MVEVRSLVCASWHSSIIVGEGQGGISRPLKLEAATVPFHLCKTTSYSQHPVWRALGAPWESVNHCRGPRPAPKRSNCWPSGVVGILRDFAYDCCVTDRFVPVGCAASYCDPLAFQPFCSLSAGHHLTLVNWTLKERLLGVDYRAMTSVTCSNAICNAPATQTIIVRLVAGRSAGSDVAMWVCAKHAVPEVARSRRLFAKRATSRA